MVRHVRLGAVRWELPGGHAKADETAEDAARREVLEETGVPVQVGALVATCVHEWAQQRERRIILFFAAQPAGQVRPVLQEGEPDITEVGWVPPTSVDRSRTSAFLSPLLDAWPAITQPRFTALLFRAEHRADAEGRWHPYVVD